MKKDNKIFQKIIKSKKIIGILLALALTVVAYFILFKKDDATTVTYTIQKAEKGSLITTVSGTGTVSAYNQVELKPKVSGDITSVVVSVGDQVKKGQLIATIDSRDAAKSVRDAEIAYQSAKLSYDKAVILADESDINTAKNNLSIAEYALEKTSTDAYDDLITNNTSLSSTLSGIHSLLNDTGVGGHGVENLKAYRNMAILDPSTAYAMTETIYDDYKTAKSSYDSSSAAIKSETEIMSDDKLIELISAQNATAKSISSLSLKIKNLLEHVENDLDKRDSSIPASLTATKTTVNGYLTNTNSIVSGTINLKNTVSSSSYSVTQKQDILDDLLDGPDKEDIDAAKLSLQKSANSLADTKEKLTYYRITSPFDGMIAKMNIKSSESISSDSVSSGSSIATIVAQEKMTEITLNEVDISKVETGQKATVTFDAIEDLTLVGTVAEMDLVGESSQGVVSYTVKIGFDSQDDRVKSGMSATATIITDSITDVITLPSSAVKTQGDTSYVEVTKEITDESQINSRGNTLKDPISTVTVTVGVDNGDSAVIESGIDEGEYIIIKTSTKSTSASSGTKSGTASSSPSIINVGSGGMMGGPR